MILNGKVCLTGCNLHGYTHVSILFFNRSIQYSWLFLLFQVLLCLFVLLFLYVIVASGGEKENYIKYEHIGGGSPGLF